jgi:hypothetical protein
MEKQMRMSPSSKQFCDFWVKAPDELYHCFDSLPQRECFEYFKAGMTQAEVARKRDCSTRAIADLASRMKGIVRAAGYDPDNGMTLVSPEPQILKGRTAFVKIDANGEQRVSHYYNKTDIDREKQLAAIKKAIHAAASSMKPFQPSKAPKETMAELCTVYTLTDFHLGMYSWADETGADWDMHIAKQVMLEAFHDMMEGSPASEQCIFAQIGDFMHFDGLQALTPTSKHLLDADTRFPLIVQTAIEVCVGVVEMLTLKHKRVHVLMAEGNHDMASSVWLRAIMSQVFKHNKRVSVDISPFPFYNFVWGETFIGWHHGHLQKMDNLPLLFATDPKFRSEYGQCRHTYIHTGHMHHQKVIDKGGIVVEQHPTLAARDAHGARGFLSSNRETKAITYSKTRGEVVRCTVRPRGN